MTRFLLKEDGDKLLAETGDKVLINLPAFVLSVSPNVLDVDLLKEDASGVLLLETGDHLLVIAKGDTLARLTAPGAKTTSSFQVGVFTDAANPGPAEDLAADKYTEMEFCVQATEDTTAADVYDFRLTAAGAALDTYTVTPTWTIGSVAAATLLSLDAAMASFGGALARATSRLLAGGTATSAALILRATGRHLAAATTAGAATVLRQTARGLTAATTACAAIILRRTGKALAAATTACDATIGLIRLIMVALVAAMSTYGATLTRQSSKLLGAATTAGAATILRHTGKPLVLELFITRSAGMAHGAF